MAASRNAATRWMAWYQRNLKERPFRTNVASGALVMLLGDTCAQHIELREKRRRYRRRSEDDTTRGADGKQEADFSSYDPSRAAVMVSWSAVGDVPINLALFSLINRAMKPFGIPAVASFPQSLLKGFCFFVPGVIIRMPCFISYVTSCEHMVRNAKEGRPVTHDWVEMVGTMGQKMHDNLLTIFDRGAKLWIPVNTLCFWAVPVLYRPLTLSFVTVGWMTYLSLMQHQEEEEDKHESDKEKQATLQL
mmetsp:Transcript_11484/g.32546  ORF Transcript_11484/g.32546 Transcript_11484/m.32546 type:complete len:248 (-) Transcript_11484:25-768(-)